MRAAILSASSLVAKSQLMTMVVSLELNSVTASASFGKPSGKGRFSQFYGRTLSSGMLISEGISTGFCGSVEVVVVVVVDKVECVVALVEVVAEETAEDEIAEVAGIIGSEAGACSVISTGSSVEVTGSAETVC